MSSITLIKKKPARKLATLKQGVDDVAIENYKKKLLKQLGAEESKCLLMWFSNLGIEVHKNNEEALGILKRNAKDYWLVCPCCAEQNPLESPWLTLMKHIDGTYTISRRHKDNPHQPGCKLETQSSGKNKCAVEPAIDVELHAADLTEILPRDPLQDRNFPNGNKNRLPVNSKNATALEPSLAKILFTLIADAGLNKVGKKTSILEEKRAVEKFARKYSGSYQGKTINLGQLLTVSPHPNWFNKLPKISLRDAATRIGVDCVPHAYAIFPVNSIDIQHHSTRLDCEFKDRKIQSIQLDFELSVAARLNDAVRAPFLCILKAVWLDKELSSAQFIDGYAHPIVRSWDWCPIDSYLERQEVNALYAAKKELATAGIVVDIEKVLFSIAIDGHGHCKPDFSVRMCTRAGEHRIFVIETQGSNEAEYLESKELQIPLYKKLGTFFMSDRAGQSSKDANKRLINWLVQQARKP